MSAAPALAAAKHTTKHAANTVAATTDSITPSATTIAEGQTLSVAFTLTSTDANLGSWVGMYAPGDVPSSNPQLTGTASASSVWEYDNNNSTTEPSSGTPATSGTVTLSTSGLAPGAYTLYLFKDSGYDIVGTPVTITIVAPTLSTSTTTVTAGGTVTFNYSAPSNQLSTSNWVGWYQSGQTPGGPASTLWAFTQTGTTSEPASGSTPVASGTVSFNTTGLAAGTYTVYFLYNDGYTVIGTPVTITVKAAVAVTPGTLTASETTGNAGDQVSFNYSMPSAEASSSNNIAWFPAGSNPISSVPLYAFNKSVSAASGTVSFDTTGLATAKYDVYLRNSSGAAIAGPVTISLKNNGPQLPSPGQLVGEPNLIVNGGAEVGSGTLDGTDLTTVPGWTTTGLLDEVQYDALGGNGVTGYPTYSTPGSADRGENFFGGGGGGVSTATQTISLLRATPQIAQGNVKFNLGGWIGGTTNVTDTATVTATFLDSSGKSLGTATLDPVTPAMRNNTTEFLPENSTGMLPKRTTSVKVELTVSGTTGATRSDHGQGYADNLSFTIASNKVPAPKPPTQPVAHVPHFDHVFVVMMENQDYNNIIGNSAAPYINSLLAQGANLKNIYALTHPSDPNYTGLAAGSLYNQTGNTQTAELPDQQIGDLVSNQGGTWRAYMQSENGPCDLGSQDTYTIDDTPFHNFQDVADNQASCQEHEQPLPQMAIDLQQTSTTPEYVWFSANDCDDMEGCGITAGDTWLSQTLPEIFNSPAWTQQRSLLILTWDEDSNDNQQGQPTLERIPTLLLGSQGSVEAGSSSNVRYTTYSLLRTTEAALGLSSMTGNDYYANPINDIWSGQPSDVLPPHHKVGGNPGHSIPGLGGNNGGHSTPGNGVGNPGHTIPGQGEPGHTIPGSSGPGHTIPGHTSTGKGSDNNGHSTGKSSNSAGHTTTSNNGHSTSKSSGKNARAAHKGAQ